MTHPEKVALQRGLPAAIEAENDLIAQSLITNRIPVEAEHIKPGDFTAEPRRIVWRAMQAMNGRPITSAVLAEELERRGELAKVGGFTFVASLVDGVPPLTSATISETARIVREKATRRRLVNIAGELADLASSGDETAGDLIDLALSRLESARVEGQPPCPEARTFEAISGRYVLRVPEFATEIEVDRLRRERQELIGELAVRCRLPGAKAFDGSLSIADLNLSSARARQDRAKLLASRSAASTIDWAGLLEECVQRVLAAERAGQPAIDLRTLSEPDHDEIHVEGFTFPRRHSSILFGDGGAAKSYTALHLAGRLAENGLRVALFDWELAGEDHRQRLRLLFGADMPRIVYARCERPLVAEADRLTRIVRDERIDYAFFDSIAFACDGPPEAAEVAGRYFRAVREIGVGSLHIAHVNKSDDHDKRPFGSAFWHNGARCTWYAKTAETSGNESTLTLGFFNRKANLGPIRPPLGLTITFAAGRTTFRKSSVADSPDLAMKMTVRQRMLAVLRHGAMPADEVAEAVEAEADTVKRTARRYKNQFVIIEGGKLALCQPHT
jgi:hypothetical protein